MVGFSTDFLERLLKQMLSKKLESLLTVSFFSMFQMMFSSNVLLGAGLIQLQERYIT